MRRIGEDVLIFPRRGNPPACPEGYTPDKGDKYVFLLKIPACEFRETRTLGRAGCCGGESSKLYCTKGKYYVTRYQCSKCTIRG